MSKKEPQIEVTKDEIKITLPIEGPLKPSKSGKSMVIATTHGSMATKAIVNDKPVWMGVNVFIKN